MSEAKKGARNPMSGKKLTDARKAEIGETFTGEAHPAWKGDKVSYRALHAWVARHKIRTKICTHCGRQTRTEFANISGEYKRDVADFIELCRKCHNIFDQKDGSHQRESL